ncbi:hypothetical protein DS66_01665 [Mesotoga sp. SC_3PWM13N19]|nr:hypothetical protein DS66_01665 [Mesotoga sp. SC_3PWM13N19]
MVRNLLLVLIVISSLIAFGQNDIFSMLRETEELSDLSRKVESSGLDVLLSGPGPFTLFAPINEAFAKLPPATGEKLSADASYSQRVLLYHIVSGKMTSQVIVQKPEIDTLLGQSLAIDARGGIRVDGASILVSNIEASNGIIHIINAVILPREEPDIVQVMRNTGILDTFVSALEKTGIVDRLRTENPLTIFAPSDIAFARIPLETRESFFERPEWMREVLLHHVARGFYATYDLIDENALRSLQGDVINVKVTDQGLDIDGTLVNISNIVAENGIIHIVNHVTFPTITRNSLPSIRETMESSGFYIMLSLLEEADLGGMLDTRSPMTVLALSDKTLLELEERIGSLSSDEETLVDLLAFHFIPNEYLYSELKIAQSLYAINGKPLYVKAGDRIYINDVPIIRRDVVCRDGVIHEIESVIIK